MLYRNKGGVFGQVEEKEAVAGIGEDLFAIALDQVGHTPSMVLI